MKFLKLTLVAIFSIALLTAVLPLNETESNTAPTNHEVKTTTVDLAAMIDRTKIKAPTQG